MHRSFKTAIFLLRLAMGWLFFYAGITKVLDPSWTAAGYLQGAKTFSGFYNWLALSQNINWVNFLNEWGLTLLGIALIVGVATRLTTILGIILMLFYYFPVLDFPRIGEHGYIIDEHLIYVFVLFVLSAARAGRYWGLDKVR